VHPVIGGELHELRTRVVRGSGAPSDLTVARHGMRSPLRGFLSMNESPVSRNSRRSTGLATMASQPAERQSSGSSPAAEQTITTGTSASSGSDFSAAQQAAPSVPERL
jgi:hypothetical protein